MKVLKHGVYYYDTLKIVCNKCNCKYEITKEDINHYIKPKKVRKFAWGDCWTDKYYHYTACPECGHDNELENRDFEILTINIIGGK